MRLHNVFAIMLALTATLLVIAQEPSAPAPEIKYPLTVREGPWLIHIGSFRGDEPLDFAHRFAEETRKNHRLLTFIYSMNEADAVKDREELRKKQLELIGTDKVAESNERIKFKTVRVIKEYSVFVGNFADMEKARYEAARIKEFKPPTSIGTVGVLMFKESPAKAKVDPVQNPLGGFFSGKTATSLGEGKPLDLSQGNPYRQAFVVRNPLTYKTVPQTKVNQNTSIPMDPSWVELNAREKHSIFTCPKNWTLVVARFSPPAELLSSLNRSVVQTGGIRTPSNDLGKSLETAAETARQVAELLRDGGKGYDAYVFHTRSYSLVTVGAFDSRFDPKMEQAWTILTNFAESQTTGPFALLQKLITPMQIPGR